MAAYAYTVRTGYSGLLQSAMHQLDLYAAGIDSELSKYESLASMVDLEPEVQRLLHQPRNEEVRDKVNKWLLNLNVRAGSTAIIVMNSNGVAIASSNWYERGSFVGQDLPVKSLYENTPPGQESNAFIADRSSGAPLGYFARAMRHQGEPLGVVAVKVSLATVESTWVEFATSSGREKLLVIDENDVVIMSSNPAWRFRTLTPLTPSKRLHLAHSDRYPNVQMEELVLATEDVLEHGGKLVRLSEPHSTQTPQRFLSEEHSISRPNWRLMTLSDVSPVHRSARHAAVGAAGAAGIVALLLLQLRQRRRAVLQQLAARQALQRVNDELERRVEERTGELRELNAELVAEVAERGRTEQTLREAQAKLIRSGRLALLGQMSVAISHEINQPLTALRALSDNSRRLLAADRPANVERNLIAIAELTERMGRITSQLKSFARRSPATSASASLGHSVGATLELARTRLQAQSVEVCIDVPEGLRVLCDSYRLEQVLLNLVCNAIDAMKDSPRRLLTLRAERQDGSVRVRVSDTGTGLSESAIQHLFEPFFSTKPPGEGLGLGLVISSSIVQEFGSSLQASNSSEGAVFEFDLHLEREMRDVA